MLESASTSASDAFLDSDAQWMEIAFEQAQEALAADEVPVGCVFVHEGREVGRGRNNVNHTRDPTRHAEMIALEKMEEEKDRNGLVQMLPGMTLYVTLEPCIMCASAMYQLGIKRIVYGADNERFGGIRSVGSAEKYFENPAKITVVAGVQAERSISLLKAFYEKQNPFAPEEKRKVKKRKNSEDTEESLETTE